MLHLKRACCGLWLIERGILLLEGACFVLWLPFMAYGTRSIKFKARFLCFIAYRTRNGTFEARMLWFRLCSDVIMRCTLRMCSEYGPLATLTVCTERTIRHLLFKVRNSATVLGMTGFPITRIAIF